MKTFKEFMAESKVSILNGSITMGRSIANGRIYFQIQHKDNQRPYEVSIDIGSRKVWTFGPTPRLEKLQDVGALTNNERKIIKTALEREIPKLKKNQDDGVIEFIRIKQVISRI